MEDLQLSNLFFTIPRFNSQPSSSSTNVVAVTGAQSAFSNPPLQSTQNADCASTSFPTFLSQALQTSESTSVLKFGEPENNLVKLNPEEKQRMESKLKFLMDVLPLAETAFLKENTKLNDNDLTEFVFRALEEQDYPIKGNESEDTGDLGIYTTAFDINRFLGIFPDPFHYFADEIRTHQFNLHSVEFLKRRYRKHSVKKINRAYRDCGFNLTKTCEFLDQSTYLTRSTKRNSAEIKMPETINLPFMQEACFIEHRDELKRFFICKEEAKTRAYEEAKGRKELIDCNCCYDQVLFEDCAVCSDGDIFCKACVLKSVEVRIGDGLTTFPCLLDCGSDFSLQTLQSLLNAQAFSKLLKRIQLDEVRAADIEGLEICPFCEFAAIPPPNENIFSCLNPECLVESCRKCHKANHLPQLCEEGPEELKARKLIEDEMTKALVRQCWKCKKCFIKSDGCNKMTCACGASICYICRQPVKDYKHFNGPGGSELTNCPLYSTEQALHGDAVIAVAEKAIKKLKLDNPDLKLKMNPTDLLPSTSNMSTALPLGALEDRETLVANLQNFQNNFIV